MIAEAGLFSLVIALCFSLLLVIVPTIGLYRHQLYFQSMANIYVLGQFIFVSIAYLCLTLCFLQDDFSVLYVMENSSISLPWFYKACAVWGGHEGSMLLWISILSFWLLCVCQWSQSLASEIRIRVLVVLGALSIGFLLFLLTTSNPFLRQFQVMNSQGRDLNPLLQDPGFLFHPPMLYMGYVGLAVAFAFAIAALWLGRIESSWAKWTRPWTLAAWCCLTIGITLGSWWAYRELGWGGWWFWDPVENASFMPWLVSTALIHSLITNEKRQQFKSWTLLLAITAFSLSLMGTFLVRSGVLTSVHAFAVDPQRGLFILCFLLIVIGGALLLFALRSHTLQAIKQPALVSRESGLFLNNVFLMSAMMTVLMGTVYPLIIDGLGLGKLSVGAPYFNLVFVPIILPLCILMGLGIHLKWDRDDIKQVTYRLRYAILFSFVVPALWLIMVYQSIHIGAWFGLTVALWIIFSTVKAILMKKRIHQSFLAMVIAHVGVAITMIGITISTEYGQQMDVRMKPGERFNFAGFEISFLNEKSLKGSNYHGTETTFKVKRGPTETTIFPQKRIYDIGKMAMTESAIDVTAFRDVYIALGEPLDSEAWSVRLYYKPLVRWIWAGGFMMFIGGLVALLDRRYQSLKTKEFA